jgi:hypothetical protein
VKDWRRVHLRVHELVPVLLMAVAAMLCGARTPSAIAQWARKQFETDPGLLVALGFPPGRYPSHPTVHRIFKRIPAAEFEEAVGGWFRVTSLEPAEPMAMDGKSQRGTREVAVPASHLVSLYALHSGAVVAQMRCEGKGQELTTARAMLAEAPIAGHLVMADSLLTQRDISAQIVARGGDYLLPVKENQPALRADIAAAFSPSEPQRERGGA